MPKYTLDEELRDLGNTIIEKHRPELKCLSIAYEFRDEAAVSNGRVIAGRCIRVDDRNYELHKHDIIIEIARDVWSEASAEFKTAIMDHELGHIGLVCDENGDPEVDEKTQRVKIRLRHHDIEEFAEVLERYGAYHTDLRNFLQAFATHARKKKDEAAAEEADVVEAMSV